MKSLILDTVTKGFKGLLLAASLVVLVRGHNHPGGGFAGGLIAAAAFALPMLANGTKPHLFAIRLRTADLLVAGGAMFMVAAVAPLAAGNPLLVSYGTELSILGGYYLSTHLLFDAGVYAVVLATLLVILQALAGKELLQ